MAAKADLIPFENTPTPAEVASDHSLYALDFELDHLLEQIEDEIEENGQATDESMKRLEVFARAINVKVDRIGSYLTAMETRVSHCKKLLQQVPDEIASKLKACVKSDEPSSSAIKAFIGGGGTVDGATVRREFHLRVE